MRLPYSPVDGGFYFEARPEAERFVTDGHLGRVGQSALFEIAQQFLPGEFAFPLRDMTLIHNFWSYLRGQRPEMETFFAALRRPHPHLLGFHDS